MKKSLFFLVIILLSGLFGCQQSTEKVPETNAEFIDKKVEVKNISTDLTLGSFSDKLTEYEADFFHHLAKQESILFSDNVIRYFKVEKGDTISIKNELVFQKEDGFIGDEYSYYALNYNGELDNMTINYDYVVGLADQGSGTIIVLGDNAIHTQRSCGTTTCCTTVQKNGKIEFEKCD